MKPTNDPPPPDAAAPPQSGTLFPAAEARAADLRALRRLDGQARSALLRLDDRLHRALRDATPFHQAAAERDVAVALEALGELARRLTERAAPAPD